MLNGEFFETVEDIPDHEKFICNKYTNGMFDGVSFVYSRYKEKFYPLLICNYKNGKLHGEYMEWKRYLSKKIDKNVMSHRIYEDGEVSKYIIVNHKTRDYSNEDKQYEKFYNVLNNEGFKLGYNAKRSSSSSSSDDDITYNKKELCKLMKANLGKVVKLCDLDDYDSSSSESDESKSVLSIIRSEISTHDDEIFTPPVEPEKIKPLDLTPFKPNERKCENRKFVLPELPGLPGLGFIPRVRNFQNIDTIIPKSQTNEVEDSLNRPLNLEKRIGLKKNHYFFEDGNLKLIIGKDEDDNCFIVGKIPILVPEIFPDDYEINILDELSETDKSYMKFMYNVE